jgi:hypothetical protein
VSFRGIPGASRGRVVRHPVAFETVIGSPKSIDES